MRCASCGHDAPTTFSACPRCGARASVEIRRPGLVTLLAVLQFLVAGCLFVLGAVFVLPLVMSDSGANDVPSAIFVVLAALSVAAALLHLLTGIGLWKLKSYGRTLQVVLACFGLLGFPIGTIVSILILVYMFRPGMTVLFSGRTARQLSPEEAAAVGSLTISGGSAVAIVVAVAAVLVVGVAVAGIIAAIAIPNLLNAIQRGKQVRTMGDLRTISAAVESYSTDEGFYPAVADMESLAALLQPTHAKLLPTADGWTRPLRYEAWSPRGSPRPQHHAIASAGKDGVFEHDSSLDYAPGETESFDDDIVLGDGQFVRVPKGRAAAEADWPPDLSGESSLLADTAGDGASPAPVALSGLQLDTWSLAAEGEGVTVRGTLTNFDTKAYSGVVLVATFVDHDGNALGEASGPVPDLLPGAREAFSLTTPAPPDTYTAQLAFRDADRTPLIVSRPLVGEDESAGSGEE